MPTVPVLLNPSDDVRLLKGAVGSIGKADQLTYSQLPTTLQLAEPVNGLDITILRIDLPPNQEGCHPGNSLIPNQWRTASGYRS
jgi:hypothetical protein